MKMQNVLSGLIIIGVLAALFVNIYNDLQDNYGLVETDLKDGKNIVEALNDINLMTAADEIIEAIKNIASPKNALDILGGLLNAGIGVIKLALGVLTLPADVINVIGKYYSIPTPILTGFNTVLYVSVLFIIVRYYTRTE